MREPALLERGDVVGRYVVVGPVGRGGIGLVVRAFDPDLDRHVALKRLQRASPDHRTRVLREARAMARLVHPNVVSVYDVFEDRGAVVIAMELCEGDDVDRWLDTPRSLDEILGVFVDCARGLAAAHAVGLCHRDVKPSNLIVTAGAAKVADFGLARPVGEDSSQGGDAQPRPSLLDVGPALTASGEVVGTRGYVAPELEAGAPATPRSDQYAFFVSLREALRRAAVRPSSGLRRALERGVAADPARRHPDMVRVGQRLESLRRGGRWRVLVGTAVVVAGLGGWWVQARRTTGPDPCAALSSRWDGVWDDASRRALRVDGSVSSDEFARQLDDYTQRWTSTYARVCKGSGAQLTLQTACLEHRWHQVEALVPMAGEDPTEARLAALAPGLVLDPVETCEEPTATDVADVELGSHAVASRLARVRMLRLAGETDEALTLATAACALAVAGASARERARCQLELGLVQHARGEYGPAMESLAAAYWIADTLGDARLALRATAPLIAIVGTDLERTADATDWVRRAQRAVARTDGRDRAAIALWVELGALASQRGDLDRAHREYDKALDAMAEQPLAMTEASAVVRQNLAIVFERRGQWERAEQHYQAALDDLRASSSRPETVAMVLHNFGVFERTRGQPGRSIEYLSRALALKRTALPAPHRSTALTLLDLGTVQREHGELDAASSTLSEARDAFRATVGSDHPQMGIAIAQLGALAREQGRLSDAARLLDEGIAIASQTYALERGVLLEPQIERARVDADRGQPERGREHLAALRRRLAAAGGEWDYGVLRVDTELAEWSLRSGEHGKARALLEGVEARLERLPRTSPLATRVQAALARLEPRGRAQGALRTVE